MAVSHVKPERQPLTASANAFVPDHSYIMFSHLMIVVPSDVTNICFLNTYSVTKFKSERKSSINISIDWDLTSLQPIMPKKKQIRGNINH